jgi:hypothetical protein
MKEKEFDAYKFSIKTEVLIIGIWRSVLGVNWLNSTILVIAEFSEVWVFYSRIEAIRESK